MVPAAPRALDHRHRAARVGAASSAGGRARIAATRRSKGWVLVLVLSLGASHALSPADGVEAAPSTGSVAAAEVAFLDTLEERTFRWFWDLADPENGLVPDRAPTPSFSSIAAVGFGLTAYPIGVERGYVSRAEARRRVLATLDFFLRAPQGEGRRGTAGYRGFFYHFLDMQKGTRHGRVELSTIDTTLLLAGALFCQSYFDGVDAEEAALRTKAEALYRRVDWRWAAARPPLVALGWHPERGFHAYDWTGYNEAMILYVLGLGSPTYPLDAAAWDAWTRTYVWGSFGGEEHVGFGPLFGHQYSHVFVDFRGIQDGYMRARGIDYFENSRRATLAQRAYAIRNPAGFAGYGENMWGLTAGDGPAAVRRTVGGRRREFWTYSARGASHTEVRDDGTLSPAAAAGSLPFAPELVVPALAEMRRRYGDALFGPYGFRDGFNSSFPAGAKLRHGRMVEGLGWVDDDALGIDQGPILAMIENYRTGLVWRTMRKNPHVVCGLRRAGFSGGWLDAGTPQTPANCTPSNTSVGVRIAE
jgi:hypothetical protein